MDRHKDNPLPHTPLLNMPELTGPPGGVGVAAFGHRAELASNQLVETAIYRSVKGENRVFGKRFVSTWLTSTIGFLAPGGCPWGRIWTSKWFSLVATSLEVFSVTVPDVLVCEEGHEGHPLEPYPIWSGQKRSVVASQAKAIETMSRMLLARCPHEVGQVSKNAAASLAVKGCLIT